MKDKYIKEFREKFVIYSDRLMEDRLLQNSPSYYIAWLEKTLEEVYDEGFKEGVKRGLNEK